MQHSQITAELVAEAERRLSAGADAATIAAELGLTPYVAELIAENRHLPLRVCTAQPLSTRKPQDRYDAVTIRMVERMLEVGILPQVQIGREAGVSEKTVSDIASGRREAVTTEKPTLRVGERFMRRPIRCRACGAKIVVTPCRACRVEREKCFVQVTSRV